MQVSGNKYERKFTMNKQLDNNLKKTAGAIKCRI